MGPPLKDLDQHWSREDLAAFMLDPRTRTDRDARLSKLASEFPTRRAPNRSLGIAERLKVADWLLGR